LRPDPASKSSSISYPEANDRFAPQAADQNGILREIKGQDGF
jgi:hypothetical protein